MRNENVWSQFRWFRSSRIFPSAPCQPSFALSTALHGCQCQLSHIPDTSRASTQQIMVLRISNPTIAYGIVIDVRFGKKRKTLYPWAHGRSWEHDGVCCSKHQKWLNNAQQWRVALDRLAWTGHTGQLRSRLQALEGSDQQSGCLLVTNVRKNSTHRHLCSAGKGVGKP